MSASGSCKLLEPMLQILNFSLFTLSINAVFKTASPIPLQFPAFNSRGSCLSQNRPPLQVEAEAVGGACDHHPHSPADRKARCKLCQQHYSPLTHLLKKRLRRLELSSYPLLGWFLFGTRPLTLPADPAPPKPAGPCPSSQVLHAPAARQPEPAGRTESRVEQTEGARSDFCPSY